MWSIDADPDNAMRAGLALTKAMGVGSILSFLVMMKTQLETSMNAVERIQEYSHNIDVETDVVAPTVLTRTPPAMAP